MKRIIGTIVAFGAVLIFGTAAKAASIFYYLGGSTYNSASSLAPVPPGYFILPLEASSSVTINTDTNNDGVEGDVSLVGGTLLLNGITDLGEYGTFISNTTTYMQQGTGTLSGGNILWTTPTYFYTDPNSTFGCTGPICGLLGITEGVVYPIAVYQAFTASQGVVSMNPTPLGTWALLPGDRFAATGIATVGTVNANPVAWYLFTGNHVPEPGLLVLLGLGLGAIALRSRKA